MKSLKSLAAIAAFAISGFSVTSWTADAAPVTYNVNGGWATNSGTHNLNGRAPFPGGGSYSGSFTIDDSTSQVTDFDLISQLVGRFTTFNGTYMFGAPQTSVASTSGWVAFTWFDAPAAGNRYRLNFTLEAGSNWGDSTINFSTVFTDVDTPYWVGTGIIQSAGPGMATSQAPNGGSGGGSGPAAVPLPSGLALLAGALGASGIGLRRRARRS